MSSALVATTNPVTNPTSAQLAQKAADIAIVIATNCRQGNYEDVYDFINDLASAINCCAQSLLTINNGTASSVGTVFVRNAYATNQAIPTTINTSAV